MKRKTYRFNRSIHQGGWIYAHKTVRDEKIEDKEKLIKALKKVGEEFELIDMTIRMYDNIFFFFFMFKPRIAPQQIIDAIQESIKGIQNWNEEYLFDGVYDLQEEYLKDYLKKLGFDYDKG